MTSRSRGRQPDGGTPTKTDKAWRLSGEVDPYFGVLAEAEYRRGRLTEQGRARFFQSGEQHVRRVLNTLRQIRPAFQPRRSLDFGCGVGRVAIPLARKSGSLLAVDVAPAMLAEARRNAAERGAANITFAHGVTGRFDLVHSYIVFQHIAPRRGLPMIRDLVWRLEPGGMLVLQVPYHRDAQALARLATVIKRREPLINGAANLLAGRPSGYPAMTMYCYRLPAILETLREAGLTDLRVTLDRPDRGFASMTLFGERVA